MSAATAATRTGDREAGWAWDSTADERRQHEEPAEGAARRTGAPEAVGVGQGTARRNRTEGGLGWHRAGVSRVHDKADERVHGT
jgi:hypothetical protein